jgi:hypothetical protein
MACTGWDSPSQGEGPASPHLADGAVAAARAFCGAASSAADRGSRRESGKGRQNDKNRDGRAAFLTSKGLD